MFVPRAAVCVRAVAARGMAVQPGVMKKGAMHNYIDSLQDIVVPYIPPAKYAPFWTKRGRTERWETFRNLALNTYHAGKIKSEVKGWTPLAFAREAEGICAALNSAFAKGDIEAIRPLVTAKVLQELRSAIMRRPRGVRLQWIDGGEASPPRVIAMRHIPLPDDKSTFAQVTVRTHRLQSIASADLAAEQLAKLEHKPVMEYVVFESCLSRQPRVWRICAKLTPKPAAAEGTPASTQ